MKTQVNIINAFSVDGQGGNPAGVVLNADSISNEQKQRIAATARLSEIAFVSKSSVADFKLDFFTPNRQIAHCGHATIATFTFLKKKGLITEDRSSKETIDGTRKIFFREDEAFMEQSAPRIQAIDDVKAIAESLHLPLSNTKAWAVNTGNTFILVEVKTQHILGEIRPVQPLVSEISKIYDAIGYYVFTRDQVPSSYAATTRMFAPFYGIAEESGTGMAAGPLACLLFSLDKNEQVHYLIEQGKFMTPPSRSLIKVDLTVENGQITSLYAGGDAYVTQEVEIETEG